MIQICLKLAAVVVFFFQQVDPGHAEVLHKHPVRHVRVAVFDASGIGPRVCSLHELSLIFVIAAPEVEQGPKMYDFPTVQGAKRGEIS